MNRRSASSRTSSISPRSSSRRMIRLADGGDVPMRWPTMPTCTPALLLTDHHQHPPLHQGQIGVLLAQGARGDRHPTHDQPLDRPDHSLVWHVSPH